MRVPEVFPVSQGVECARFGSGPPLLVLPPFTPVNQLPRGRGLARALAWLAPVAERYTVHYTNRRTGLAPGDTASHIVAPCVELLESFGNPVPVVGCSSGGAFALQLAADQPHLVSHVAIVAGAHRLGPAGLDVCLRFISHAEAGRCRRAAAVMAGGVAASTPGRIALTALGWAFAGTSGMGRGYEPADAVVSLRAEMAFGLSDRLADVRAPVLAVVGDRDTFYPRDVIEELTRTVCDARVVVVPGGHAAPVLRRRYAQPVLDFFGTARQHVT